MKLQPDTEEVRSLTAAALEASKSVRPSLVVRCQGCGRKLAQAGHTTRGPLWTASWDTDPDHGFEVHVGPRTLGPRASIREMIRRGQVPAGSPLVDRGIDGYVALLALPPDTDDDHVDLLVRCADHGDAVLDRRDVLAWLREGKAKQVVRVRRPFHDLSDVPREWSPME